jgi:anthranilate synthase component 1
MTDISISREEFIASADIDQPVVIRTTAPLDIDVEPLAAYAAIRDRDRGRNRDQNETENKYQKQHQYQNTNGGGYSFLLESGEKVTSSDPNGAFTPGTGADRHARYSFVGYDPAAVITATGDSANISVLDERYDGILDAEAIDSDNVLDTLRSVLPDVTLRGFPDRSRQQLDGGLVGVLAYDAVYDLFLDELGYDRPETRVPDAQFVLSDTTLVFDHVEDTVELVCTPVIRPDEDSGRVYDSLVAETERVATLLADTESIETGGFKRSRSIAGDREEYEAAVRTAKEHVLDGDIYQGVISRTRELYGDIDPLGLYSALREINPSPYMYVLGYDDLTIVGASPETLVSVRGEEVTMNPLAGTCARGNSPVEDRRLAGEMLADGKERAEHTMLVDLARNDVRRVSEPGSVTVAEFMNVLKYSHVQHIESTVTGTLADDCDAFDATRAAFPAGTLTGAPKMRAIEIIASLESQPRGVYGGALGYYSWTGDADVAIVIRTATIDHGASIEHGASNDDSIDIEMDSTPDRITVQAGAGIVADSDPTAEYEETEQKMNSVLAALETIEEPTKAKTLETEVPR